MIVAKASRLPLERTRRRLILKMICACLLLQVVWLLPGQGLAQEGETAEENPPSNEEFVRESVRSLLETVFGDFPEDKPQLLRLGSEEEHPANWLVEDELVSYLVSSEYEVALKQGTSEDTLQESQSLFYRIIELSLRYPEIKRQRFLGGRRVVRKAMLNLSFRLEDTATGKVLWSERVREETSDLIERSMAQSVNNRTYPFLSPSLPDDPQSRYVEPALVIAVVGGLIYLFFASR
jgi:hypothetical protein